MCSYALLTLQRLDIDLSRITGLTRSETHAIVGPTINPSVPAYTFNKPQLPWLGEHKANPLSQLS